MNDKIKINLRIAEANYPLVINREEEEIVRKAAKQVDDKLNKYRAHFPNLETERFIAMVAYELSLDNLRLEKKNETAPFTEKIVELTQELETYFRKE